MMPFSFGGTDLSALLICAGVKRATSPERRLTKTEVPGRDGYHVADEGASALELSVDVHMLAEDPADVAECRLRLASALSGGEGRLVLPDDPGRYYMARFTGGDSWSRAYGMPSSTLTFLAADPVAYGGERRASVGTSATYVDAGGTYRSYPTVTCKPASGSYWQLANVTTGDFVRVEASFTGSQTVVLDMARERCTVNGTDHAVTLASDFFALDGAQQLKTSSGTATLEWEERWL